MADKRISELPYLGNSGYTTNDIIPIVNYLGSVTGETKHTPIEQFKNYILSGVSDNFVTGGTYSNGTITLDRQNGSVSISGLYTGSTDVFVTGGTYNPNNGIATFTNNNGETFDVSGFLTGYTNFYTTGATLSGTTIIFDRTDLLNAYDVDLSSLILYSAGTGLNSTVRVGVNAEASGNYSLVSGGLNNTSSGGYSTVSGGQNNKSIGSYSTVSGGYRNTANEACSIVNGGYNLSENQFDTIAGGGRNTTLLSGGVVGAATISGGYQNTSGNYYTFNGGGCNNITLGEFSSIVGGLNNQNISGLVQQVSFNSGDASTIPDNTYNVFPSNVSGYGSGLQITFDVNTGVVSNINLVSPGIRYEQGQQVLVPGTSIGGSSPTNDLYFNLDSVIESHYSSIGGGRQNTSSGNYSTVSGGFNNTSSGDRSTVVGGTCNTTIGTCSVIGGGLLNTLGGSRSFIGGGQNNISGVNNFVSNVFGWTYTGGTINGTFTGVAPTSTSSGTGSGAYFNFDFVGGVLTNVTIQFAGSNYTNVDILFFNGSSFFGTPGLDDVYFTIGVGSNAFNTIAGGQNNKSLGNYSTLSGGYGNTSSGYYSFIGGGGCNTTIGGSSTVSGGQNNTSSGNCSTVSGGRCNSSLGFISTIAGGEKNTASDYFTTIAGGSNNKTNCSFSFIGGGFCNTSSGNYSTISGGYCNTTNSDYSGILGGVNNIVTGNTSFAISCQAQVYGDRSVVIGGSGITATENDMVYMPNVNIQSTGYLYIGDVNVDNSWRYHISGNDLVFERRVGGVWTNKMTITG